MDQIRLQRKLLKGQKVKRRIAELDFGLFRTEGQRVSLPFPGFLSTVIGSGPPREFLFTARSAYREVLYTDEYHKGVIITGAKGAGKSCILRAVAVELIGRLPRRFKVVCFWYLDACSVLSRQVQDALLFTYCDADTDEGIIAEIQRIATVEDLSLFLRSRKESGDMIVLVSDGEERYDIEPKDGFTRTIEERGRRTEAKKWLETFERQAYRIIKAVSPEANEARRVPELMKEYKLQATLSKVEYLTYLEDTILARILQRHPIRQGDVDVHGGRHPMSLYLLNKACEDYVRSCTQTNPGERKFGIGMLGPGGQEIPDEPPTEEAHLEYYLDDEEAWERMLAIFRKGEPFRSIRKCILEDYHGDEESLRTPELVLRSYVDNGFFCTNYLRQVHMQAAEERLNRRIFRSPKLQEYLNDKLNKPEIVWPEVAWACEVFLAEAVMALGLKFQGHKIQPSEVRFLEGEPVKLNPGDWEVEKPIYFRPGKYSFEYVDGLLVWVDKERVMHILALQVTVSPENHRSTEYKFMQRAQVERWYSGKCVLYYLYLCPATPGVFQVGTEQKTPEVDMAEYKSEELWLSECFGPNLGLDALLLLTKLARLRENEVKRRGL